MTSFSGRPEEKFKKALSKGDTFLRTILRKVKKEGIGTKDVYLGEHK